LKNEGGRKTMKTLNSIACAGSIAIAMLSSSLAVAESSGQETAATNGNASSQVHRVSHALAGTSSYRGSSDAGYKWGRKHVQSEPQGQWSESVAVRGSYKWDSTSTPSNSDATSYAGTSSYGWNTMSLATQSGYRWGHRSNADQVGYRWGHRSDSDQAGYRWGHRNDSDQAGYRWGHRNDSDQAGYRWGHRTDSDQAGYRWGHR